MTQRNRVRPLFVAAATLALVVTACGGAGGGGQGTQPTVVATTSVVGELVSDVVGDEAKVEVLMPVGTDSHDFQPSSRQVALIQQADLVVAVGLGLEEGLIQVLEAAEADGANVLELAPRLDPIPFRAPTGGDGEAVDGDDGEAGDPHVWMDPLRWAEAARLVAAELTAIAPDGNWGARAESYAARLQEADERIEEILSVIPEGQRKLVTNHDAFGYLADRYRLEVVGVIIPGGSTLAEPSSEDLAELVALIQAAGVRAIFAETTQPSALAEAVAAEVGDEVEVVELYTESVGESGSAADTLIGMLLTNAERVAAALS